MELKLYMYLGVGGTIPGFNRTFMELKLYMYLGVGGTIPGFNRTFMELKLAWGRLTTCHNIVLIVPLWN